MSRLFETYLQFLGTGILASPLVYACRTLLALRHRKLYPIFRTRRLDGRVALIYA